MKWTEICPLIYNQPQNHKSLQRLAPEYLSSRGDLETAYRIKCSIALATVEQSP